MFKIGDKVFDNERGYGEGVVTHVSAKTILVDFSQASRVSYTPDGKWLTHMEQLFKKEEKMKNYYYVGQKVSHQAFGDGEVSLIDSNEDYPVMVDFRLYNRSFTIDERYSKDELPSLSQKPHVPLKLEEIVSFEKGDLVWVMICEFWQVRYFSHQDGDRFYFFVNQAKSGRIDFSRQIRKFSDNPLDLKV